jgi:predicted nuclease of predicted toxin-antitoxin system
LDENLGPSLARLLRDAKHDVTTVLEQQLCASSDETLLDHCREEARCLVTLDLDFSNPLKFKPSAFSGIAVLRLSSKQAQAEMIMSVQTLIEALKQDEITGKLWIIQSGRWRIYDEEG